MGILSSLFSNPKREFFCTNCGYLADVNIFQNNNYSCPSCETKANKVGIGSDMYCPKCDRKTSGRKLLYSGCPKCGFSVTNGYELTLVYKNRY